jgi:hypothetical protein
MYCDDSQCCSEFELCVFCNAGKEHTVEWVDTGECDPVLPDKISIAVSTAAEEDEARRLNAFADPRVVTVTTTTCASASFSFSTTTPSDTSSGTVVAKTNDVVKPFAQSCGLPPALFVATTQSAVAAAAAGVRARAPVCTVEFGVAYCSSPSGVTSPVKSVGTRLHVRK